MFISLPLYHAKFFLRIIYIYIPYGAVVWKGVFGVYMWLEKIKVSLRIRITYWWNLIIKLWIYRVFFFFFVFALVWLPIAEPHMCIELYLEENKSLFSVLGEVAAAFYIVKWTYRRIFYLSYTELYINRETRQLTASMSAVTVENKPCGTLHIHYISPFKPSVRPIKGTWTTGVDPDQTPQNTASDQGLHCLL